jgi:hypothetical protein
MKSNFTLYDGDLCGHLLNVATHGIPTPKPTITALIRVHTGREGLANRAVNSIIDECSYHALHFGDPVSDYSYNTYCNKLKSLVHRGYFFFLDSDDVVIPGAINKIIPYLREDKALIVQMLRNGRPKPRNGLIERGKIGLPCMILHSKHKHLADLDATEFADYTWIKAVTDKIGYEFVPIPLVDAGKRNRGK